jgi:hypothetical protein
LPNAAGLVRGADGQKTTYTNTDYIGGFVYQNNVLQFVSDEEGRIRPYKNDSGQVRTDTMVFDYFLKDHLGDTRVVLTDAHQTDAYPMATMEVYRPSSVIFTDGPIEAHKIESF